MPHKELDNPNNGDQPEAISTADSPAIADLGSLAALGASVEGSDERTNALEPVHTDEPAETAVPDVRPLSQTNKEPTILDEFVGLVRGRKVDIKLRDNGFEINNKAIEVRRYRRIRHARDFVRIVLAHPQEPLLSPEILEEDFALDVPEVERQHSLYVATTFLGNFMGGWSEASPIQRGRYKSLAGFWYGVDITPEAVEQKYASRQALTYSGPQSELAPEMTRVKMRLDEVLKLNNLLPIERELATYLNGLNSGFVELDRLAQEAANVVLPVKAIKQIVASINLKAKFANVPIQLRLTTVGEGRNLKPILAIVIA